MVGGREGEGGRRGGGRGRGGWGEGEVGGWGGGGGEGGVVGLRVGASEGCWVLLVSWLTLLALPPSVLELPL